MGLKDTLKSAVDTAFSVVDDLTTVVNYTNPGDVIYNPSSGLNTTTGDSVDSIKAIFIEQPSSLDTEADIEKINPQILLKAVDFSFALTVNGYFTVDGVQFEVISWSTDPSNSLYTIDVARSK